MTTIVEQRSGEAATRTQEGTPPQVAIRITDVGTYYKNLLSESEELGPFTVEQEQDPLFDVDLARRLHVEPKEILAARLSEIKRPTTFQECAEVLGSTIRHDIASKLILFAADLLTFTDQDQINIVMSGESAGGKSYNVLEVASYFPKDMLITIATASPTAFFHDQGVWDSERSLLRVDLEGKIVIFLDMPHYMLMERLRPLASHDQRNLLYKITDRSKKGSLRTKNVEIHGYPTLEFCAAKFGLDEQEKTRVIMLSPETDPAKLSESIRLKISRDADRNQWNAWVQSHPRRRWLKARIEQLRTANVKQVIVPSEDEIFKNFAAMHPRLNPRHQRDISRIVGLMKAHALLNWHFRESPTSGTILASKQDIDAGFWLYDLIAKPNELGVPPQVYEIYQNVIMPLLNDTGVTRQTCLTKYYEVYGRTLDEIKLRREILPSLESCGLIMQEPDPGDKRRLLIYPTTTGVTLATYTQKTIGTTSVVPTTNPEGIRNLNVIFTEGGGDT